MARGYEVLQMLIPQGGWIMHGEDFEGIEFLECEPITKAQFEAGFKKFDAWKAEQDAAKLAVKEAAEAKLAALGLTTQDLRVLGL